MGIFSSYILPANVSLDFISGDFESTVFEGRVCLEIVRAVLATVGFLAVCIEVLGFVGYLCSLAVKTGTGGLDGGLYGFVDF